MMVVFTLLYILGAVAATTRPGPGTRPRIGVGQPRRLMRAFPSTDRTIRPMRGVTGQSLSQEL
jgi:hypothetical protein